MVINVQDNILILYAMGLLDRLLKDKATNENILWVTAAYSLYGEFYRLWKEICSHLSKVVVCGSCCVNNVSRQKVQLDVQ